MTDFLKRANNLLVECRVDTLDEVEKQLKETSSDTFTLTQVTNILATLRQDYSKRRVKDGRKGNSTGKTRSPTTYNFFVKFMLPQVHKKFPDMHKNTLMKKCGVIWRTKLDDGARKGFSPDTFKVIPTLFDGLDVDTVTDAVVTAGKGVAPTKGGGGVSKAAGGKVVTGGKTVKGK